MNAPIRPFTNYVAGECGRRWPTAWFASFRGYWHGDLALGNMSQYEVFLALLPGGEEFLFGLVGYGCYKFSTNQYKKAHYVESKLDITQSDAENLSDFMNELFHIKAKEQGTYDDCYCKDD